MVFGKAGRVPAIFSLSSLNGTNGFALIGIDPGDGSGGSVSSAGDVNGDGFDDLLIGAKEADLNPTAGMNQNQGESYVVFGAAGGFPASIELFSLDGTNGFALTGINRGDQSGISVSSAGDVNGDGFDDLLIGADAADQAGGVFDNEGESYVMFGKSDGFPASFSLSRLNGTNGFVLTGTEMDDGSGFSVSSAGDVNGDGFDDLIIGASEKNQSSDNTREGKSYVVFGKSDWSGTSPLALANLNGTNGFVLTGIDAGDMSGYSVSGAGDVNGDGFDDLIIGAPGADQTGQVFDDQGETYVVFGKSGGFAPSLALSSLDGTNGFMLTGIDEFDFSGHSVSGAGDVNGDGFDDLIIGADRADQSDDSTEGESYVVFGGNFTGGAETQVGDADANTLTAALGAGAIDILIGAGGNDTLISDGGPDVLRGGEGDDILAIPDTDFSGTRRLVGGTGRDMLRLDGASITLDLTAIADNRITGIELIDIRGSGANSLMLDFREVLNLSTHSNTVVVRGDADDVVHIGSGWERQANEVAFGETFEVFANGVATLKVASAAAINHGITDIVGRNARTGTVVVGVSDGSQFINQVAGVIPPGVDWDELVAGDFNGDGLQDLAGRSPSDGRWRVLLATNGGFAAPQVWGAWSTNVAFDTILVGDYNGDGRDDVAGWAETGTWIVGLSNGVQFKTSAFGAWSTAAEFDHLRAGDFNGDGKSDVAGVSAGGRWVVGLSDGSRFQSSSFAIWSTTAGFHDIQVGDFNGDGLSDIAGISGGGRWVVGLSDGNRFALSSFAIWSTAAGFDNVRVGDFNGDGRSDIAGLSANGRWVVGLSNGVRFVLSSFAIWSSTAGFDDIRVGDFNGDGKSDVAGRSASGKWLVGLSDGTQFASSVFTLWSSTVTWDNVAAGNIA